MYKCVKQSAETSPLDCLVSYPGHSVVVVAMPPAEKKLVYSTDPSPQLTEPNLLQGIVIIF